MIGSHFPAQHANKHVHHWDEKTLCITFAEFTRPKLLRICHRQRFFNVSKFYMFTLNIMLSSFIHLVWMVLLNVAGKTHFRHGAAEGWYSDAKQSAVLLTVLPLSCDESCTRVDPMIHMAHRLWLGFALSLTQQGVRVSSFTSNPIRPLVSKFQWMQC